MPKVNVKICGLRRIEDAYIVNRCLPDYAGMILSPGFSRSIDRERATEIRERLDPAVKLVGVFVNEEPQNIVSYFSSGIIDIAQLHGDEEEETVRTLQRETKQSVWKAFRMEDGTDVNRIVHSPADLVLLDASAGSGHTFDWSTATKISRPFFLAGGLTPENVARAVAQVHPFGVDVSSGVESDGQKDEKKILDLIANVRQTESERGRKIWSNR